MQACVNEHGRYEAVISLTPPPQGAPESVLERCQWLRVGGGARLPLTTGLRERLLGTVREWGSGRDTLRCLAMATRDAPPDPRSLNLENTAGFADYEVRARPGSSNQHGLFLHHTRVYCGSSPAHRGTFTPLPRLHSAPFRPAPCYTPPLLSPSPFTPCPFMPRPLCHSLCTLLPFRNKSYTTLL